MTTLGAAMGSSTVLHVLTLSSIPFAMLAMAGRSDDPDKTRRDIGAEDSPAPRDDLPYRVELWNEDGTAVEQILAVTADSSIGYAAYHAAAREYPDRYLTLRHQNRILSRWNPRQ